MIYTIYTYTVTFFAISKAGDVYMYKVLVKESVRILEYKKK